MEQNEVYEALGLTPPEAEAEVSDEVSQEAEAEVTEQAGENDAETAEPQTKEERHRQAAARRKRELDEAIRQAREEASREAEERFAAELAKSKLENPLNDNSEIKNLEDLIAYNNQMAERNRERALQKSGLSAEEFDALVESSPVVQAAKAVQAANDRAAEAERLTKARDDINREIEDSITPYNDEIRTMEDLVRIEGEPLLEKVNRGMTVSEAYFAIHREEMLGTAARRGAKQSATRNQGKAHMRSTQAQGTGARAVPTAELNVFRRLNPTATEEEIQRFYNRFKE